MANEKKDAAAAATTQAAAASGEAKGENKTVDFREITLTLPPELPATLLFDVTELEVAGQNPMPVFRLLRSLVGPDQFAEIRNALNPDDDAMSLIDELLGSIFGAYGIELGE